MDKRDFTIGCLSLTACILLVGVFVLAGLETRRAEASGMIHTSGSFALFTGKLSDSNELVYLLDNKTENLAVYRLNETSKVLELTDVVALDDPQAEPQKHGKLKP